jgi:CheY-like chemotaxis protein
VAGSLGRLPKRLMRLYHLQNLLGASLGMAGAQVDRSGPGSRLQTVKRIGAHTQVENPRSVLNVDDNPAARFVRTRVLERAGFVVAEVDNAAQAIEQAPDASLVLLDVRLPDGDGFTVCEQVKAVAPDIPVVMVTSVYRTSASRRDAFAVGADAYLLEPVPADQLVRTVESLIHGSRETRPAAAAPWIVTDWLGHILDLSDDAAKLLNLSPRGARGRSLPTFFVDHRQGLIADVRRASEGLIIERVRMLRPRERRPVRVRVDVSELPKASSGERTELHWVLTPEPTETAGAGYIPTTRRPES